MLLLVIVSPGSRDEGYHGDDDGEKIEGAHRVVYAPKVLELKPWKREKECFFAVGADGLIFVYLETADCEEVASL